jgi:excisionase family DNA binding protein
VNSESVIYTVNEASQRLRISASLVYGLCARGIIAHRRCGLGRGTIRIDEEALKAYLDRSTVIVRRHAQGSRKTFTQLDSTRLVEAWKQKGAL